MKFLGNHTFIFLAHVMVLLATDLVYLHSILSGPEI